METQDETSATNGTEVAEVAEVAKPNAKSGTKVATFHVTGEFLTDISRQRVVEGQWDSAARFLMHSLDGMDWGQAFDVLSAKKKLVGASDAGGVNLADEEPEVRAKHEAQCAYTYAGRFPHGNYWWRPYAIVIGGCRDDAAYASEHASMIGDGAHVNPEWSRRRALFYATSRDTDRVYTVAIANEYTDRSTVLFERIAPAPPWMDPPSNEQDAVRAVQTTRGKLERCGPGALERIRMPPSAEIAVAHEEVATQAANVLDKAIAARQPLSTSEIRDLSRTMKIHTAQAKEARAIAALDPEAEEALARADEDLRLQKLHDRIVGLAALPDGGGFIDLELAGKTYIVPRAPFEQWSLWRTRGAHLAHPWPTVCRPGERMFTDDPLHTDWILGVGVEFFHSYLDPETGLKDASYRAQYKFQEKMLGFEVGVLSGRGWCAGPVLHPEPDQEVPSGSIIVIPEAGPDYVVPALSAGPTGAVICERGGELSHLAQIAIEDELRLVRCPDALRLYPSGTEVEIDCDRGKITIPGSDVRGLFG